MRETPCHQRPEACFVCGGGQHQDGTPRGGHRFWSNTEALAHHRRPALSVTRYSARAEDFLPPAAFSGGEVPPFGTRL